MIFVAITKASKGEKGPSGFPLECREYSSAEEAAAAHPGCVVMCAEEYHEYAAKWHEVYQTPKPVPQAQVTALAIRKRPWWKFWSRNG